MRRSLPERPVCPSLAATPTDVHCPARCPPSTCHPPWQAEFKPVVQLDEVEVSTGEEEEEALFDA